MTHWTNPWDDAIPVTLEELAECDAGLGQSCRFPDGTSRILTKEDILSYYRQRGDKLDPYILLCPSGWHCLGVRYGNEGCEYLSPLANQGKVRELLKRRKHDSW